MFLQWIEKSQSHLRNTFCTKFKTVRRLSRLRWLGLDSCQLKARYYAGMELSKFASYSEPLWRSVRVRWMNAGLNSSSSNSLVKWTFLYVCLTIRSSCTQCLVIVEQKGNCSMKWVWRLSSKHSFIFRTVAMMITKTTSKKQSIFQDSNNNTHGDNVIPFTVNVWVALTKSC